MIGFLIGTVCLAGLLATLRAGRYARRGLAYGGGCGAGACGPAGADWGSDGQSERGERGWYQRDAYGENPWGWHRGGHRGHGRWGRGERGESGGRDGSEGRGTTRDGIRRLFQELDTTPGQEKVILAVVKALDEAMGSARDNWKNASHDVAQVFRKESFDELMLAEAVGKLDSAQDSLRKAVVKVVGDVHSALDEKQRARFAELIEQGHVDFLWRLAGLRRGES